MMSPDRTVKKLMMSALLCVPPVAYCATLRRCRAPFFDTFGVPVTFVVLRAAMFHVLREARHRTSSSGGRPPARLRTGDRIPC